MNILTDREWFLLVLCSVTYVVLFVVTVQNSRRKIMLLQERLNKVRELQEEQHARSHEEIDQNRRKISELEGLLRKLEEEQHADSTPSDNDTMLRLELEEKKARLDYEAKMAEIEGEKRCRAESVIFGSDIYARIQQLLDTGGCMGNYEWRQLEQVVNSVYSEFTERLYGLYKLSEQEYHVSLLVKVRLQPKDIGTLTAHSKESVASTRSRLYQKVFGEKGSSKEWDDFVLSL